MLLFFVCCAFLALCLIWVNTPKKAPPVSSDKVDIFELLVQEKDDEENAETSGKDLFSVTNAAGKKFECCLDEHIKWRIKAEDMSEEEFFVRYLSWYKHTKMEIPLLAEILLYRKGLEEYPDTIRDLILFTGDISNISYERYIGSEWDEFLNWEVSENEYNTILEIIRNATEKKGLPTFTEYTPVHNYHKMIVKFTDNEDYLLTHGFVFYNKPEEVDSSWSLSTKVDLSTRIVPEASCDTSKAQTREVHYSVTNGDGKIFHKYLDEDINWIPMKDEELLARYLCYMASTPKEAKLLAKVFLYRRTLKDYPDTLADVIFFTAEEDLEVEFWNSIMSRDRNEHLDYLYMIRNLIKTNEVSLYESYTFISCTNDLESFLEYEANEVKRYHVTEDYIFYTE